MGRPEATIQVAVHWSWLVAGLAEFSDAIASVVAPVALVLADQNDPLATPVPSKACPLSWQLIRISPCTAPTSAHWRSSLSVADTVSSGSAPGSATSFLRQIRRGRVG